VHAGNLAEHSGDTATAFEERVTPLVGKYLGAIGEEDPDKCALQFSAPDVDCWKLRSTRPTTPGATRWATLPPSGSKWNSRSAKTASAGKPRTTAIP
jgi:hypothetical protein